MAAHESLNTQGLWLPPNGWMLNQVVFSFPCYFVESAQSQKDKFETLCRVTADISGAPYTSKLVETGQTAYERKYDVILLVGLTELKAQVSWNDSETVRTHLVLYVPIHLIRFPHT